MSETVHSEPVSDDSGAPGSADDPQQGSKAARVLLRSLAELAIGIALGLLILWVLVVSVTDIEFVYQGF